MEVREQPAGFFYCIDSIGACPENHIFSPKIQDGEHTCATLDEPAAVLVYRYPSGIIYYTDTDMFCMMFCMMSHPLYCALGACKNLVRSRRRRII